MVYIELIIDNICKSLNYTKGLKCNVSPQSKGSYGLIQNMNIIDCLNILELNNFKLVCINPENMVTSYILHCPNHISSMSISIYGQYEAPKNKLMERDCPLEYAQWP